MHSAHQAFDGVKNAVKTCACGPLPFPSRPGQPRASQVHPLTLFRPQVDSGIAPFTPSPPDVVSQVFEVRWVGRWSWSAVGPKRLWLVSGRRSTVSQAVCPHDKAATRIHSMHDIGTDLLWQSSLLWSCTRVLHVSCDSEIAGDDVSAGPRP